MSPASSSQNLPSAQILAGSEKAATMAISVFQSASIPWQLHKSLDELLKTVEDTPGVLVFLAESLDPTSVVKLSRKLSHQPHWSDVPIIVSTPNYGLSEADEKEILQALHNVTILPEPLPAVTLASVVRNALTARRKQFEIRDLLLRERMVREAAEQSSRLKDEFLATLSHELRTPLNAIVGYSELLPLEMPHSPAFFEAIEQIARNARVQSQLINDILDISKIITGKLELNIEPVKLDQLLRDVTSGFRCAAKAKSLRLHLDLGEGTMSSHPKLLADPLRMRQIIWNLLSNAIKFTPEHGHIWVTLREENKHIRLTLSDSGKGIEAEFLPYVFDLFRQQEAGFNRSFGGLGLGLSIVRHLVEAHGGEVFAESRGRGQGASFTLILPSFQAETNFPLPYERPSRSDESSAGFVIS